MENINITFTGIIDYIRDKDSQIEFLQKQNNRYLSRYNKLQERIDKAIEYLTDEKRELSEDCYYKVCELAETEELLNILQENER